MVKRESEPGPSTSKEAVSNGGMIEKEKEKKKVKRRRRRAKEDEEFMDVKSRANQLKEKFGRKKAESSEAAFLKQKGNKVKAINCGSHNKYIRRAEEFKINKIYQVEFRSDVVPTQWRCALCHGYSGRDELGDLFGPYYITLTNESHWPSHLTKKPSKLHANSPAVLDVWLHGDCVLWTPRVQMRGAALANLQEELDTAWKQHCTVCKKDGASIQIGANKFVHFPCAKKQNYRMDWSLLSCRAT